MPLAHEPYRLPLRLLCLLLLTQGSAAAQTFEVAGVGSMGAGSRRVVAAIDLQSDGAPESVVEVAPQAGLSSEERTYELWSDGRAGPSLLRQSIGVPLSAGVRVERSFAGTGLVSLDLYPDVVLGSLVSFSNGDRVYVVEVAQGRPSGRLAPSQIWAWIPCQGLGVGSLPPRLADFTGDGFADLFVPLRGPAGDRQLLVNQGNGFSSLPGVQTRLVSLTQRLEDNAGRSLELDANGDGLLDILTFERDLLAPLSYRQSLTVALGRGAGPAFESPVTVWSASAASAPTLGEIAVGDWDGDGCDDVVVTVQSAAATHPFSASPLLIALGQRARPNAPLGPLSSLALGRGLLSVRLLGMDDWDGDGRAGVMLVGSSSGASSALYLARPDGNLMRTAPVALTPSWPAGTQVEHALLSHDRDDDGDLDLVMSLGVQTGVQSFGTLLRPVYTHGIFRARSAFVHAPPCSAPLAPQLIPTDSFVGDGDFALRLEGFSPGGLVWVGAAVERRRARSCALSLLGPTALAPNRPAPFFVPVRANATGSATLRVPVDPATLPTAVELFVQAGQLDAAGAISVATAGHTLLLYQ